MRVRDLLPWRDFVIGTSWSPSVAATEMKSRLRAINAPAPALETNEPYR